MGAVQCSPVLTSLDNAVESSLFVWCAVFTQGERGIQVTGIFLVFAVGLHLVEAVRNSAAKKEKKGGRSIRGGQTA